MDDKIKLLKQVSIFDGLPQKDIENLSQKLKEVHFTADEAICEIEEPGDQMYIIKSGEVKVVVYSPSGGEIVLDHLSRGYYFGEMALLTGESRSASVIATLDTTLYTLHKKDFNELISRHPVVVVNLSRVISDRLKKTDNAEKRKEKIQKAIVFSSNLESKEDKLFALNLTAALRKATSKKTAYVDLNISGETANSILKINPPKKSLSDVFAKLETMDSRELEDCFVDFNGSKILGYIPEKDKPAVVSSHNISAFLGLAKMAFDIVVIDIGNTIENAEIKDSILKLPDSALLHLTDESIERLNNLLDKDSIYYSKVEIAFIRRMDDKNRNILDVYKRLKKEPKYQVHLDENFQEYFGKVQPILVEEQMLPFFSKSMRRLARQASGNSIGIALGADGARSYAAVGILEVLEKEGIEFDFIVGTGGGGVVAALYGAGKSPDEMKNILKEESVSHKFALKLESLTRSNKEFYAKIFKDTRIEELNLPVYLTCVDIIKGEQVILSKGAVVDAVSATTAIPGFLPPEEFEDKWLVTGAVLNIVPGDVAKELGAGMAVAVDVSVGWETEKPSLQTLLKTEKNPLLNLIKPWLKRFQGRPFWLYMFYKAVTIPSRLLTNKTRLPFFDIYICPDLTRYKIVESDKNIEKIIQKGKESALEALPQIKEKMESMQINRV